MMRIFSVISSSSQPSLENATDYEIGVFCCVSDVNKIAQ